MNEGSQGWREFVTAHGAPEGAERDETAAARDGDVLADLSFWSLIRVSGADAQAFLQGQLTNDVRDVVPERSQISAWCTPKGRMLAIFRVFRRSDGYFLQLPGSLKSEVLRRLRMYVLRAKVVLEDADADLVRLGISGPNAVRHVTEAGFRVPDSMNGATQEGSFSILALAGPHPRFELIGPPEAARERWLSLATDIRVIGVEGWAWLNIKAGIPEVLPGTVEAFVPQMANLDLLQGVSFTKGCYPGQEIVARVKYLGRIKQRMFPGWTAAPECPPSGMALVASPGDDQAVGWVVDARAAPEGGYDMLVVVGLDQRGRDLRLGAVNGPPVTLGPAPYPVENSV